MKTTENNDTQDKFNILKYRKLCKQSTCDKNVQFLCSHTQTRTYTKTLTQKSATLWLIVLLKGNLSRSRTCTHSPVQSSARSKVILGRKTRASSLKMYIFYVLISIAISNKMNVPNAQVYKDNHKPIKTERLYCVSWLISLYQKKKH